MSHPELLVDGPPRARHRIVLAHGAGAPMDSPFMDAIATGLVAHRFRVVRFEFPYMAERRRTGRQRPPDGANTLLATWQGVLAAVGRPERLIVGGKSMGGRFASMVADAAGVRGLVCLGYPFHPPGRPDRLRTEHLLDLTTPTLIVQGERDPLGPRDEVDAMDLSEAIEVAWMPDGDHSFKPRVRSGYTEQQNLTACVEAIVQFVGAL